MQRNGNRKVLHPVWVNIPRGAIDRPSYDPLGPALERSPQEVLDTGFVPRYYRSPFGAAPRDGRVRTHERPYRVARYDILDHLHSLGPMNGARGLHYNDLVPPDPFLHIL